MSNTDNQLIAPSDAESGTDTELERAAGGDPVDDHPPESEDHQPEGQKNRRPPEEVFAALSEQAEDDVKTAAGDCRKLQRLYNKLAGEQNEPEARDHPSAPSQHLRPRSEVVVFDRQGVWLIDKGDYLLFPGGGVDDGEQPLVAAAREVMEEADIHPLNLQARDTVEAVWPADSGNDFWDASPFAGERSYFFIALHGGTTGFDHPDREDFERVGFKAARLRLRQLIKDPDQQWAVANNRQRLRLVNECARLARLKSTSEPVKLADAVRLRDRDEYLLFTPEGKVVVADRPDRRLRLPDRGQGMPVPYERPARLIPSEGVEDEGYHGYQVRLLSGLTPEVPEGYRADDPSLVLNQLYASMGLPQNKTYRDLDRARARALLRELRRRKAEDA